MAQEPIVPASLNSIAVGFAGEAASHAREASPPSEAAQTSADIIDISNVFDTDAESGGGNGEDSGGGSTAAISEDDDEEHEEEEVVYEPGVDFSV